MTRTHVLHPSDTNTNLKQTNKQSIHSNTCLNTLFRHLAVFHKNWPEIKSKSSQPERYRHMFPIFRAANNRYLRFAFACILFRFHDIKIKILFETMLTRTRLRACDITAGILSKAPVTTSRGALLPMEAENFQTL